MSFSVTPRVEWQSVQHSLTQPFLDLLSKRDDEYEQDAFAKALVQNSADCMAVVDAHGFIVYANPAFTDSFGVACTSHRRRISEFITTQFTDPFSTTLQSVLRSKAGGHLQIDCLRHDGSIVTMDARLSQISLGKRTKSVLCNFRDITHLKQVERELRIALERQRELSELKSQFISVMSHEVRTPLTTIQSSSDLLILYGDRISLERRQDALETIQTEVKRVTGMLDEVLMISRSEIIGPDFSADMLDLRTLCEEVITDIKRTLQVPRSVELRAESVVSIQGDAKLLRHMVLNLLSNAVKYSSPPSQITLQLSCSDDDVTLTVSDEGIGIPCADRERLFRIFTRGSNVGSIAGTGFGLIVIKRAVEAHGGSMTVESEEGVGTTFKVVLPKSQPVVSAVGNVGALVSA